MIAMFILAATPGPGLLLVSLQTSNHHLLAGFLTTVGIICADIVFILLVTLGLGKLTEHLQFLLPWINIFGGCYLLYIGWQSLKSDPSRLAYNTENAPEINIRSNVGFVLSGFLITLSNPKAILFYISFLPAFVELNNQSANDIVIIMLAAIISITPTMLFCAWMTQKAKTFRHQQHQQKPKSAFMIISAVLIMLVGIYMIYRGTILII